MRPLHLTGVHEFCVWPLRPLAVDLSVTASCTIDTESSNCTLKRTLAVQHSATCYGARLPPFPGRYSSYEACLV